MSSRTILCVALLALFALSSVSAGTRPSWLNGTEEEEAGLVAADTKCTFNGFTGTCKDLNKCDGTSVAGHCPGPNSNQCCIVQKEANAGCGTAAIKRAMTWVHMHLLYCQSAWMQRDYDSACSSICYRSRNPHWNAYRSDCSGFVSYAYGLPAPGRVTSQFAPFENDISYALNSIHDLAEGDVLNSDPSEHIMIFRKWLDKDHSSAELLEEPGCSANPPYARVTKSGVKSVDGGKKLVVQENGLTFVPVRFRSNDKKC